MESPPSAGTNSENGHVTTTSSLNSTDTDNMDDIIDTSPSTSSTVEDASSSSADINPITPIALKADSEFITAAEFNNLNNQLLNGKKNGSILLIDCRSIRNFLRTSLFSVKGQLVAFHNFDGITYQKFPSKLAVVNFFQERNRGLASQLHAPGHFTNVMVVDEDSTPKKISVVASVVKAAMIKWNENTTTKVQILDGGTQALLKQFPSKSKDCNSKLSRQQIQAMLETKTDKNGKELILSIVDYLESLEKAIALTKELLDHRGKLKSLEAVKIELLKEHELKIINHLDNQVPYQLRCPSCNKIFEGEIVQCVNGHSICSECCETLKKCAECDWVYAEFEGETIGKVRNRTLEKLMVNGLHVFCSCEKDVICKEIKIHAKECLNENKMKEVEEIEEEIGATENELGIRNRKLEVANTVVAAGERKWNSMFLESQENKLVQKVCKELLEVVFAMKVNLSSLNVALVSSVFLKEECRFKAMPKEMDQAVAE